MNTVAFTRADKTIWGRWWWTIDRTLLFLLLALALVGVVLVATASPPVAQRINLGEYHFIFRHIIILIPALLAMVAVSLLDLRNIWRLSTIALVLSMGAMILVLIFGQEIKGAQRWIPIMGFSLQPSEFVKPALAVVSAWLIARQKDRPGFPGYAIAAVVSGAVLALLIAQPDLGMTILTLGMLGAQIFLAGLPLSIVFCAPVAILIAIVGGYFIFDHVHRRINQFIDPANSDTFQIDRALDAIRHGGIFGTGPGQGTVKLTIPDAHSDFIFSVAGEEMGFFLLIAILALYAFIVLRGLNRVMDSDNMFTILATGGLLMMFGLQALVHVSSNLHLIPTKGMTLPFISYGGSSLLATAFAMGMVLALTRKQARVSVSRTSLSARPAMVAQL